MGRHPTMTRGALGGGPGSRKLGAMPTNPSDEPEAQAHALVGRLFALLHDCRAVVPGSGSVTAALPAPSEWDDSR
jgi:hypothetical protein